MVSVAIGQAHGIGNATNPMQRPTPRVFPAIMSASINACARALREQEPLRSLDLRSMGRGIVDRSKFRDAVTAHAEGTPS